MDASRIMKRATWLLLCLALAFCWAAPAWADGGDLAAGDTADSPALPKSISDGVYAISIPAADGLSLAVKGDSAKAGASAVLAEGAATSWSQKWIAVRDEATGYYTVRNLGSRMMLSVAGTVRAGAKLKQAKQSSAMAQRWVVRKQGGKAWIASAADSSLAVAAVGATKDGFALQLEKAPVKNGSAIPKETQLFKMRAVEAIDDGHSYFITAAKGKRALAVPKDSRKAGAALTLAKSNGKARYQKFRFIKAGKNAWAVQCVSSCQYVQAKGSKVRQYPGKADKAGKAGKAGQKAKVARASRWSVSLDLATGLFSFAPAASASKRLDASGKPAVRPAAEGLSQQFALVPTFGFKLYVDPGHGQSGGTYDPGAPGSGREEADLTKDLAGRIEAALAGSDVEVVNGGQFGLAYWKRNPKAAELGCDAALSVHFDVGGGSSTMTMVGTRGPLQMSKAFNRIIHKHLVAGTGLRDGGTTTRGDITFVNGKVPAVLMEVCFIDNYGALGKYLSRRDTVAASIADGVVEASRIWGTV